MLREYEKAGFIKPIRVNGQRRFSNNDIKYIKNILFYLEDVGMTITGLKLLYMMVPCWEIKQCGDENCPAHGVHNKSCWELVNGVGQGLMRQCEACPIYLTNEKNIEMKIKQDKGSLPKCDFIPKTLKKPKDNFI